MVKIRKNIMALFDIFYICISGNGRSIRAFFILIILSVFMTTSNSNVANARTCRPCVFCPKYDTDITVDRMNANQDSIWEPRIENDISNHINSEENWIVEVFFEDYWVKALAELTNFLGAFGMFQAEIVGTFFDSKNHLETRRLFFELQARAHKDYHPSDDFCWFGTNSRSIAATESLARRNMLAMSERSLQRQLGHKNSVAADGIEEDKNNRWEQFISTYCDPKDNSWTKAGTGLDLACDRDGSGPSTATGAIDISRVNRDIDYTRLIDEPRTLNIDFTDTHTSTAVPSDEEDVMAMAANLYGSDVPSRRINLQIMDKPSANRLYMDLRSVVAKRNVAENSFHTIVSMKSTGSNGSAGSASRPDVGLYMASLIKDLMPVGTSDDEVFAILGENPSYYAQLEFLSKKIYQNPDFYANLYDKPANVKRKSVAMKAIELMLDRALFESELRQEMMLSVMLSSKLNEKYRLVNRDLSIEVAR